MNPPRVWLIDDTESNRRLYGDILARNGYEVACFSGAAPALETARATTPDLVVLDVRMPGMNGFECCAALRQIWGDELVPIVMLTAIDDRDNYVRGLEAGAHDYLVQPVEIDHLRVRVHSLLRLRAMHLELRDARRRLAERVEELRDEVAERERQLVMADRLAAVGQMAAAIAHEINNPLTYVSANANYCLATAREQVRVDAADWLAAMEAVVAGVERIREVIYDVQTFSRAPVAGSRSDVRQVIESAASMANHAFRHCAELARAMPEGPVWAAMPQSQLAQVVLNLLVNAAHACEDRGHVRGRIDVRVRLDGDRVVIEVADTGVGIPPEHIERVFEPFYTSKDEGRGTGLGLSLCRDYLARSGGAIDVSSEVGVGTTFRVEVPAAAPPEPRSGRAGRVAAVPDRPARVVIVDDEPLVGLALARMLPGYHVRTFVGVAEALDAAREADAIVCDLMMPDRGGIRMYELLPPDRRDRLVFISGGGYRQGERDFLDSVPNRRLDKPVSRDELRDAIAELVAQSAQ